MYRKQFYTAVILLSFLIIGIRPAHAVPYALVPGTNTYFGEWTDGNTIFTFTSDLNSGDGIYMQDQVQEHEITIDGAGHTITGPTLSGVGVNIVNCRNITIKNLNVTGFESSTNEFRHGIIIQLSFNITLTDNSVWNNNYGMQLVNSFSNIDDGNIITNNTISNNRLYGIRLDNSNNNTIKFNTFFNNSGFFNGLDSGIGIRIRAGSTNNEIINNNFISNYIQASVTEDLDQTFDRNYWDDWNGSGPYTFNVLQQDNNPLPIQNGWLEPEVLVVQLIDIVTEMNLHRGIDNSLDAKLDAAFNALVDVNQNNDVAAINSLNAFINAVEAQRNNKITNEQADILIVDAQYIIDLILAEG